MENLGTLYMLCGKMAAGKSTYALAMSKKVGALLVREDHLLGTLYPGAVVDVPSYSKYSERVKLSVEQLVVDLLSLGTSVVLDFPANTIKQRAWLRQLAERAEAPHELHFIDVPDSVCKSQMRQRVLENPARASTDTETMFDAMRKFFEAPLEKEDLNIHRVTIAKR